MEHSQDVKTVAWHPKEELLASASYDDTIKLYVDDPGEEWFAYTTLTGHTSTIWSLSFSPCGDYLASASEDKTVRIWRRLTPEQAESRGLKVLGKIDGIRKGDRWICVRILKGWHTRSIYSVSWGSDPEQHKDDSTTTSLGRIATAGADGQICIFQVTAVNTDESRRLLTQGNNDVTDGQGDPINTESNLAPNIELIARQYQAHGDADVNCVSWAPAKLQKATNLHDEAMRFRELNEEEAQELEREDRGQDEKDAYPLSNLLASAADDGTVKVWIL
jgi:WD40 repeat protein